MSIGDPAEMTPDEAEMAGNGDGHVRCDLCDCVGHHPGSGCGCGAPELERVDTVWKMCGPCADEDARLRALAAVFDSFGPLDCRKAAARCDEKGR